LHGFPLEEYSGVVIGFVEYHLFELGKSFGAGLIELEICPTIFRPFFLMPDIKIVVL